MLRISVTTIEQYRQYLLGRFNFQELLARLRGESKPSRFMALGSAFHDILENNEKRLDWTLDKYKANNGIEFDGAIIRECLKHIDPDAFFELKLAKDYPVGKDFVKVVAKVDMILGNIIWENKTCWSQYTYDRYADSCQWKYYLDIFGADKVVYNVFILKEAYETIELKGIEHIELTSYPDMNEHLNYYLDGIYNIIKDQGLEEYFKEKKLGE